MATQMKYEASGESFPCDRCGLMAKMHGLMSSGDDGETWEPVQYRNPRTKRERNARYCEPCAKEVCGIFPPIRWAEVRKAMETLGREKAADSEISELKKEAETAKKTVLRYLIQNDADSVTHGGYTAKLRTRNSNSFDKDVLEELLTEEQLREATRTSESQFVAVSEQSK